MYALGHARNLPAFWGAEAVSQRPDISGEEFGVERVGCGRDGSPGKLLWLPGQVNSIDLYHSKG